MSRQSLNGVLGVSPRRRGDGRPRSGLQSGGFFPLYIISARFLDFAQNGTFERVVSLTTNYQPLATLIVFFYLTPHRQMSYFWGTGREPPTKRITYVSNRTHLPRWLRTFRSIGHHRPRNCEGHFRRSCTQGAWRQTRR